MIVSHPTNDAYRDHFDVTFSKSQQSTSSQTEPTVAIGQLPKRLYTFPRPIRQRRTVRRTLVVQPHDGPKRQLRWVR